MDIQTKHRVTLLNAKCNYVCAVDTLVQKSNYGEDIGCCIEKLYLASRLINRLECFCFDEVVGETEVSSKFVNPVGKTNYLDGTILTLISNGIQIGSYTVVGTVYKPTAWEDFLDELELTYTSDSSVGTYDITITNTCDITSMTAIVNKSTVTNTFDLTVSVVGVCAVPTPPCYNCIEASDLPKMYEVLGKLLQ
jgi:hypothetical protein